MNRLARLQQIKTGKSERECRMLRVEAEDGWWLITHQDHARLAAVFAAHWGNAMFPQPRPRAEVLRAIHDHDNGWAARDLHPVITRQGKPAAFSTELVGAYSAFEEIDLADYLAVRESALDQVEANCAYAALLVSMHTYNLLTERADRSTIAPDRLPLLDSFLTRQLQRQGALRARIRSDSNFAAAELSDEAIVNNFRLLQATDNLSLLSCVAYMQPATLLHPLPTNGGAMEIKVTPLAPRAFRLAPYPLDRQPLTFEIPARYVAGQVFSSSTQLEFQFAAAPIDHLAIKITG
jgi:hypothetical protein